MKWSVLEVALLVDDLLHGGSKLFVGRVQQKLETFLKVFGRVCNSIVVRIFESRKNEPLIGIDKSRLFMQFNNVCYPGSLSSENIKPFQHGLF